MQQEQLDSRIVAAALGPDLERAMRGLYRYQARAAAEGVRMTAKSLGNVEGFRCNHAGSLLVMVGGSNSAAQRIKLTRGPRRGLPS